VCSSDLGRKTIKSEDIEIAAKKVMGK
jgi:histone H3/H4